MTPLAGLGIWIWELHACEGGNLDKIISKALASGISWIAVKCGEETANGQFTLDLAARLKAAGITPVAWWYCRPGTVNETRQLGMLANIPADHFIIDAETPWETGGDHRVEAARFAKQIRGTLGADAYIADAPWPIPTVHPAFPFAEFGTICDARMDQFYWRAAGASFTSFAARADHAWSTMPDVAKRCPIASTVDEEGSAAHAPVSELAAFLDHYAAAPTISIWSWQHLNADEWALLATRADERATAREGMALPGASS